MSEAIEHEGGCLCGAVRYRIEGEPEWSGHCHCKDCQKAVGAGITTWIGSKHENFHVTKGEITRCETTQGVFRGFCGKCGSSLTYVNEVGWPGQTSIAAATSAI